MPKIWDNGVIREMTLEEAEMLEHETGSDGLSLEEKVNQLEEALNMLLSGVTE